MSIHQPNIADFAPAILKLLQGAVYQEDTTAWRLINTFQVSIKRYLETIGLFLIFNEQEGFAYLSQFEPEELEKNIKLPRLIRRIPLSYEVSLLLIILREFLEEFDVKDTLAPKCFITNSEIKERIAYFMQERANESKLFKDLDKYINEVVKLNFLHITQENKEQKENTQYEIKRIIKAKVSLHELEEVKRKLSF